MDSAFTAWVLTSLQKTDLLGCGNSQKLLCEQSSKEL